MVKYLVFKILSYTEINNFNDAIAKGLDMNLAIQEINKRQKRIVSLSQEKKNAEHALNSEEDIDSMADEMISSLDDFKNVVKEGDYEDRKRFIRVFVKGMTINPDSRTINTFFYKQPCYASTPTIQGNQLSSVVGSPNGIRTRVTRMRI